MTPSLRTSFYLVAAILLAAIGFGFLGADPAPFSKIGTLGQFFLIGILAATIANSTGAGGGIVFLPVFMTFGLSVEQSLGTSFAIQCFGMTAGALTWLIHLRNDALQDAQHASFRNIFLVTAAASIAGLRLAQEFLPHPAVDIEWFFSLFSIAVGLFILQRTLGDDADRNLRDHGITGAELAGLAVSCFIGGAITAWLSVGVGEILAIHLIALRFRVNLAVAAAVCVTSVTVITAVPHYLTGDAIRQEILAYAAPGALIGGTLARTLAVRLGARRLKIGMALWIILSAMLYLLV